MGTEPGEAEPGEADSQQVADQEPAKAAPASGSKPEKALPAMATEKAKAKAKALAAPSKAQWNDVHYTMKKLEKAGKMDFPEKWKKACSGGHQTKREFYYHTFLLDPEASKKEVHKSSLERPFGGINQVERLVHQMAAWGNARCSRTTYPMFEQLCTEACKGLPERDHENEAWARLGVKQFTISNILKLRRKGM